MAAAITSVTAGTIRYARCALAGDNLSPCALRSTAVPIRAFSLRPAEGRRKGYGLKTRWMAQRLVHSTSGGKLRRTGRSSVKAEIYIESAEDEGLEADAVTIPDTQSAWLYKEYGPKEVLGIAEVMVPKVGADQVLLQVHAAALNPVDFKRRLGKFKDSDSELPTVPGYDVAGVVVHAGREVKKFKVGDRVYGDVSEHALKSPKQFGSLAQFCAVEEKLIAAIPERLNFEEAASLPLAVETAYQGFERTGLKEGETVLILGGAGGVGSLAVQLAKHIFKASFVAATTSGAKAEFVKGLGADIIIDYQTETLQEHPTKYDVVLDTVGKGESLVALKENGRAAVLTGPADPPAIRFVLTSRGDILETLNPFLEDGTLKAIIDTTGPYQFSELVEAFSYLEEGRATGKVVISTIS